MKQLDGIVIEDKAIKEDKKEEIYEYVKTLVRNEELLRAKNKKIFKEGKKKIQNDHANVDAMTAEEKVIRTSLGKNTEDFIKARKEVIDLKEEVEKCRPLEEVKQLCTIDYVHLILMAHVVYPMCVFPEEFFDYEKGGIDVSDLITKYYNSGSIRDIKNTLRPIFNKLLGTEGDYFYAIKIKRSDFDKTDVIHFLLRYFIKLYKNKKVGLSPFDFKANSFNQRKEFTDFCCVVMGKIPQEAVLKTNKVADKEIKVINALDLMVRCTIFKCMHENHNISDIDAKIMVLDENGQESEVIVSAGYCAQCNIYFIMDSVYQNLKKKGIILCRITDEKTYLKGGFMNGAKLAQESILMQYGYNVSQMEGLSATRRQKILAVIIDNKVLSKNEIISYLDFFIRQHGRRSNMELAVAKWEDDRDFVEHYGIGEYTRYGVNAIHRR